MTSYIVFHVTVVHKNISSSSCDILVLTDQKATFYPFNTTDLCMVYMFQVKAWGQH